MEEDIKRAIERLSKGQNDIWYATLYSQEEQDKDIKLLIKGYRELEEENKEIKSKNNAIKRESEAYAKEMINLHNELKLEKEKSKYEWIRQNCLPQNLIYKLYISKSKVKEIRDKAEVMDYYTLPDVIKDLNKLLGDEE